MNNNTEYLGTYPELGQIYANAIICDLDFEQHLNLHNEIFRSLVSLSKRIAEENMSGKMRYEWKSRIAALVHATMICMEKPSHCEITRCEVLKALKETFEELEIEI